MVRLNGQDFIWRPNMSVVDLMNDHNSVNEIKLDYKGTVIVVNDTAITAIEARTRELRDNESVYIVPIMDGG